MENKNKKRYSLNGNDWFFAYAPNSRVVSDNLLLNTSIAIKASGYKIVPAEVPGNYELDLFKAGIIEDPYYSTNVINMQKLECMHIFYYKEFYYFDDVENLFLCFEGIDTVADIYLNGELIESVSNMFIKHEIKIKALINCVNDIVVHIKPAVIEARKLPVPPISNSLKYNYDSLYIRKAGSMFGWDIMPRIVSGGIWRDVYFEKRPDDKINDVFAYTLNINRNEKNAKICFHYNLDITGDYIGSYSIKVYGKNGDSSFYSQNRLWFNSGKIHAYISNCNYWWPKNYGQPDLYETVFELYKNDILVDKFEFKFGVRIVELDRTSTTDINGSGEFCIKINNQKIFAMGSNWVPVDAFHSNDVKRLPDILPMLCDLNCNIVRCWGGNVYEHENFYDFCDENGIMIWQDFAMGCAAYPQEQKFLDMLEPEIINIIQKYRNHASLIIWAGDNECDYSFISWGGIKLDPNNNIITRGLIPKLLNAHDFTRPYLPSSPYIDHEAFLNGENISEDHLWGPRDYFKGDYYKNTVCHFASETGYHGCPSPNSLEKYISKENLWPWYDSDKKRANDDWLAHATSMELSDEASYLYRIGLMSDQVKTLFGHNFDNLDDFSLASQISQAEAKKYFIERFRLSKWRRTGIIWWNLIDGWPQISDAVVDYYYDKKLAYYYIKRSQNPFCIMCDENDTEMKVYAVNDTREEACVKYKITNQMNGNIIVCDEIKIKSDISECIYIHKKTKDEKMFYLIEWQYPDGTKYKNHFMTNIININFKEYKEIINRNGLGK